MPDLLLILAAVSPLSFIIMAIVYKAVKDDD